MLKVLKSGHLVQGEKVENFERAFADYCGVKHAIATSSGTTALHLSLLSCGIAPGNEIITTSFSFIASTNAILYVGAKPVFVDIDQQTFNINPDLIEEKITKKTRAILPVHLYGFPADMNRIISIAKKYNLMVIEDACQAHGAMVKIQNPKSKTQNWKKVGSIGNIGCFSFYATKNMTTGEGGMVTTDNDRIAARCRLFRQHGMIKRYYHESLGFNFRMTEVAAALGLVQVKKLDQFNKKRINNANYLTEHLKDKVICPKIPDDMFHVFHQYTIKVKRALRDKLKEQLQSNGILTEVYYPLPIYRQTFYKKLYGNIKLPETELICHEVLSLPVHPYLTTKDLNKIIKHVRLFVK